jgi:hypothetical protein
LAEVQEGSCYEELSRQSSLPVQEHAPRHKAVPIIGGPCSTYHPRSEPVCLFEPHHGPPELRPSCWPAPCQCLCSRAAVQPLTPWIWFLAGVVRRSGICIVQMANFTCASSFELFYPGVRRVQTLHKSPRGLSFPYLDAK